MSDSIYDVGDEPAAVEPVVEESTVDTSEVKATDENQEVETEQAAPTAETSEAYDTKTEIEKLRSEVSAFKAKALDEVRKRQALEQAQQQQAETPDAYVEPDKAIAFTAQQLQSQMDNRFYDMSEMMARQQHGEDFDQMVDVFFNEMVSSNPLLQQQALQQQHPYEFIYQQAKTHSEFKGVNSVDDLKSKIEAEVRAKVEAEMADKLKAQTEEAITKSIPGTLSTATAAAGTGSTKWAGPMPANKLYGN